MRFDGTGFSCSPKDVFRLLTHFNPMFYFYTHFKTTENLRFSDFSEGIEMQH